MPFGSVPWITGVSKRRGASGALAVSGRGVGRGACARARNGTATSAAADSSSEVRNVSDTGRVVSGEVRAEDYTEVSIAPRCAQGSIVLVAGTTLARLVAHAQDRSS